MKDSTSLRLNSQDRPVVLKYLRGLAARCNTLKNRSITREDKEYWARMEVVISNEIRSL